MKIKEKAQSVKDLVVKTKDSFSMRQVLMGLIVLFGTAANIFTDWITLGFDASLFCNPAYWISLAMGQGSIVVIMVCVYSFMADREEQNNEEIIKMREQISAAHCDLTRYSLMDAFDAYVERKNRERKERAYTRKMERKIFRAKKDDKRKALQDELTRGLEKIEYIKVRYERIKIVEIFSHAKLTGMDDESMSDGYGRATAKMLINKVISVIAFGVLLSTLSYQPNAVGWGMLITTVIKLFQVAYGIYSGGDCGLRYARGSLLSALENRAQFVQRFVESQTRKESKSLSLTEV